MTYSEGHLEPRYMGNFLADLQLPAPQPGQFIQSNQGALLSHPRAGIVLRIEKDKCAIEHPLVAPIIGHFTVSGFSVELVVGGRTKGITGKDCDWVTQNLRSSGAIWKDQKPEDIMRLPLCTREHPAGLPVVMDREFLYPRMSHNIMNAAASLFGIKKHELQLEDFGVSPTAARAWRRMLTTLSKSLDDAFDPITGRFNQPAITAFWQLAEDYTSTKFNPNMPLLFRGWEEVDTSERRISGLFGEQILYREKDGQFALASQNYAHAARTDRPETGSRAAPQPG